MKNLLLLFAIAITATACEKEDAQICGPIVGIHILPDLSYVWQIQDEQGTLHELPAEDTPQYDGDNMGDIICIDQ